ncbi:TetR/AcrR family transcriptional regulator [Pseudonocardia humida]|uniref:TetR/AcrR family transcriptional regulator n=1 Tax=Pseudonocardia humida TaxID=2800819 RepID=A0ABT0ZUX6_9PSEU|nr:TetR/AcrR family transcriptional regulator [Pseudonocardia humida]MCO1654499.1 TetR/AcrR family transcriptional regulator [Pseudonocardia humida]
MAGATGVGAPSTSKGDRTRRRLLDAAAAEVARVGAAGASLSGIAAAAGLKTGSIYFHFASKDELIATMLEEGLRESLRLLDEALAAVADLDAGARLRAGVRAHLRALHELGDYAAVVLAQGAAEVPAAAAFPRLRRAHVGRWTELVADAQAAGVLAGGLDPRDARDLLFGAMNSALGRPGWSPEGTASALCRMLRLDG